MSPEECARHWHRDQRWGNSARSYVDVHLTAVVKILGEFRLDGPVWTAAGWLHDVVEDTPATLWDVHKLYGWQTAKLVWAVTGEGSTRAERNASIYSKIARFPDAAQLKLADRIANVELSRGYDDKIAMYAGEMWDFDLAIRPHIKSDAMWQRLENAFLSEEF